VKGKIAYLSPPQLGEAMDKVCRKLERRLRLKCENWGRVEHLYEFLMMKEVLEKTNAVPFLAGIGRGCICFVGRSH
jgi:hypothetical protein